MILNLHTSELLHNLESGAAITVFLALIVLLGRLRSFIQYDYSIDLRVLVGASG